ncbi:MAG: thymidylate synthase [Candidatus Lokiarchaeota archaeon]
MKTIKGQTINELFYNTCKEVYEKPQFNTAPRGMLIKECINTSLLLINPINRIITFKERNLSLKYLVGELAFYLAGSNKLKFIKHYSRFWEKCSDDGKTVNSCYGKKLLHDINRHNITQFQHALQQLIKDKDSRKSVMVIYDKHSADLNTKDNPCTLSLQFLIRKDYLYLITTMRSNDIWRGLSYDIPFFTILQEIMCVLLKNKYKNIKLGAYIHNVGSLHLYEKHFNNVKLLIDSNGLNKLSIKQLPHITPDTLDELPLFLLYEEYLRKNNISKKPKKIPTDKFILTLINWLTN